MFVDQCCKKRMRKKKILTSMRESVRKGLNSVSQLIKSSGKESERKSGF